MVAALLAACSRDPSGGTAVPPLSLRNFEPESIAHGAALFTEHCAQCHGPKGQGHPDWQTPSDGTFAAAPPLDGTGNDWKRTRLELATTIKTGVRRKKDKTEIMPAWKGRLNDRDIEDVLNWMQSLWPAEVYEAWSKVQQAAIPPSTAKR